VAGLLNWQWGWTLADPAISVIIGLLIIFSSWQIIRESVNILLEGTPSHIDIQKVIAAMHEVEGVINVHDLHVWAISSGKEALSAHITLEAGASHREALRSLQQKLLHDFNIGHVTLQLELGEEANNENVRLYHILPRSESTVRDHTH
jgi:cobalt-zinc-cadmium efflux system protein